MQNMGFAANFIRFPAMQKVWKLVKILQSYREYNGGNFFETQCRCISHSYSDSWLPHFSHNTIYFSMIVTSLWDHVCGLSTTAVVPDNDDVIRDDDGQGYS